MSIFQYLARCGVSALLLLLPLGAVAEPPSERATITLEVTDRAALALALAELEAKGVVRESKVNYKAPERVVTDASPPRASSQSAFSKNPMPFGSMSS